MDVVRHEQEPGGADAVGREHHGAGPHAVLDAVGVEPERPVHQAGGPDGDAGHPGAGHQSRPGGRRLGPVGEVERGLGPGGAPALAHPPPDALAHVLEPRGRDGLGARPPVPPELVHRPGHVQAGRPERVGRQREVLRRVGGVAAQPGHPDEGVDAVVVRREVLVADRPVVGHAVQRAHAEVRRQEPLPVRSVHDARAADGPEHAERRVRAAQLQRVVLRAAPHVRLPVPRRAGEELELGLAARQLARLHPVALLQAHHGEPAGRQRVRHDGAGRPGSDDQDVGLQVGHRVGRGVGHGVTARSRPSRARTGSRTPPSSSSTTCSGRAARRSPGV